MILKRIRVHAGEQGLLTNSYIVYDEKKKEAMVIDPGGEPEKIIEVLDILGIEELKYIFVTHCHADHIGGINELKKAKKGKILISRDDAEGLYNDQISLAYYIKIENPELEADSRIDDNDLIHLGNLEFRVIHTPGHTAGSTSLYCEKEKCLFSGDTIFCGTWGRTDLPTSSREDIMNSITKKILILPDDTLIYPGHGKATMLKDEKPIYLELKPKMW